MSNNKEKLTIREQAQAENLEYFFKERGKVIRRLENDCHQLAESNNQFKQELKKKQAMVGDIKHFSNEQAKIIQQLDNECSRLRNMVSNFTDIENKRQPSLEQGLLDHFAGLAMQLAVNTRRMGCPTVGDIASSSYELALAMLEERKKHVS